MAIVSATATRRAVLAMMPIGLAAVAVSDMTLRIPADGLRHAWMPIAPGTPQCARREDRARSA